MPLSLFYSLCRVMSYFSIGSQSYWGTVCLFLVLTSIQERVCGLFGHYTVDLNQPPCHLVVQKWCKQRVGSLTQGRNVGLTGVARVGLEGPWCYGTGTVFCWKGAATDCNTAERPVNKMKEKDYFKTWEYTDSQSTWECVGRFHWKA